jgi:hypothetical protein
MKRLLLLSPLCLLISCANSKKPSDFHQDSPEAKRVSYKVGSGIAKVGETIGDVGVGAAIVGGVSPVTVIPGVAISIPCLIVGAPFYYLGHAMRGTNSEGYASP